MPQFHGPPGIHVEEQSVNAPASKSVMRAFGRLWEATSGEGVLLHSRTEPTTHGGTVIPRRMNGGKTDDIEGEPT